MVSSKLDSKISKRKETVCVVETLLVFAMATFHIAIVARHIRADPLVGDLSRTAVNSKQVDKSMFEKRLVNSMPLFAHTLRARLGI